MDPNSELFRVKQQVIFYRAEIAQYKNRINELDRMVEKEIVRNKYLQEKIRKLNSEKIAVFQEEIKRLHKKIMELEVQLEEERNMLDNSGEAVPAVESIKEEKEDFYSYFNYSVILPPEGEDTISIYGNFMVVNNGDVPLEEMVVCFKVKPVGAVSLSAKIMDPNLLNGPGRDREDIEWVWAVEDWRERIIKDGEYWFKPKKRIYDFSVLNLESTASIKEVYNNRVSITGIMLINQSITIKALNNIKISL
ncbi:coiled-coil domain-containing protein [Bacillus sp. CHD6a]|uniref:coiled-coil domain-containing protein n=1 Tax=Bacillus sp. CHD6a TaxID=1643452 RepID=UPI0006CC6DEE|nr:hypothetical protein [Bacillus sp. CHD6a]KPB03558.1 hypothetical protein AAV98_16675 [Bacillus sp. CHD6a]